MQYQIKFKPRALKDLDRIDKASALKILSQIEGMKDNLIGDVKKLTNFTPEYRLRVGDYRVLFEIEEKEVIVYRVLHRKDSYK